MSLSLYRSGSTPFLDGVSVVLTELGSRPRLGVKTVDNFRHIKTLTGGLGGTRVDISFIQFMTGDHSRGHTCGYWGTTGTSDLVPPVDPSHRDV